MRIGNVALRFAALAMLLSMLTFVQKVTADTGAPPHSPRDLYVLNCSGCHRQDGAGMPPAIPDLRASLPKLLASREGRDYILSVPGVSRQIIPPEQVAAILNWSRDHLPPQPVVAPDFSVAEILHARQNPLLDPFSVRRRLIPDEAYDLAPASVTAR